ncbi:protein kinase [Streptomyces paludis]|uniref:Serine/threonine protein kinase n=1 Tax=Streptomyces paludis TaxID=2282738 RepID=A0A345HSV4_9ACTN|nr:protein kinase [Streptomyces paludis]AXG79778.1 serine/threonine protein kinase [Streptomyces paludis]
MDEYAGRVLADRYRLPLPPSDAYELVETRAFDTYSGQEVLVRQVPLPEVVEAEVIDAEGTAAPRRAPGRTQRRHTDPAVRRAIEAAQSAAQIPDHPRLDQVFDVFAESGSLWIVSELVAARPLAALLAEKPLNPYRAAEIASDVLTAVRVVHAHGWTHRNITVRTVLVCDDGRVVLTGLAAGAAEEALCGYAPVPEPPPEEEPDFPEPEFHPSELHEPEPHRPEIQQPGPHQPGLHAGLHQPGLHDRGLDAPHGGRPGAPALGGPESGPAQPHAPHAPHAPGASSGPGALPYAPGSTAGVPGGPGRAALGPGQGAQSPYGDSASATSSGTSGAMPRPQHGPPGMPAPYGGRPALPGAGSASGDIRAARAGAIAAYRAGARAAARASEDQSPSAAPAQQSVPQPAPPSPSEPDTGEQRAHVPTSAPGSAPGTPGSGPDPEWWAKPRGFQGQFDGEQDADEEEDDDPPTPYRPQLAGTWRDGPAPWNDASGSLPAGGSSGGAGAYGPHSAGPFGAGTGGTAGIPVRGGGPAGEPRHTPQPPPSGAVTAHGGGSPYAGGHPGGARDALRADAQRNTARLPAVAGVGGGGRWDEVVASGHVPAYRGPATPLAAERARQARIAVVGAVTERWAPEQAGPVHENWQLAPPIGPATDLWALGALLYRAVQGHAPYPEESAIELVQLVCAEPPAFAEECGPLRPVVESLLRQDPTERPDFEELRGWLRSLVRSAPEPEAGLDVVPVPSDETRLPIKRRRGELVRRRRVWGRSRDAEHGRHRHKKGKDGKGRAEYAVQSGQAEQGGRLAAEETYERPEIFENFGRPEPSEHQAHAGGIDLTERGERGDRGGRGERGGRSERERAPYALGRTLLLLILLLLVAVVVYAVMFMPKTDAQQQGQRVGEANPGSSAAPHTSDGAASDDPDSSTKDPGSGGAGTGGATSKPNTSAPQTSGPAVDVADGYVLREDTEGFRIAVDKTWERRPINDSGQVRYVGGDFTLIVVPGRDTVAQNGSDPMVYQRDKEREIQPFRDSSWATASGLRRIDVGKQAMAEGQYTWQDSTGREVFVRNLAMIVGGRYHVIQAIGPADRRDKVDEIYQQANSAYRVTG